MKRSVKRKKAERNPDFFIVGLQKSGTYWLTALLNSHPEIRCLPHLYGGQTGVQEGRIFDMLASIKQDGGAAFKQSFMKHHGGYYKDLCGLVNLSSILEVYEAFRVRYAEYLEMHRGHHAIVGDKTTEYVFHLDMIDDFYPGVKKVCIVRDPKDRVVSWHFQQIRKGRKKTRIISDKFVRDYCVARIVPEYLALLSYAGPIHCLSYELLSSETRRQVRLLLTYLGISYDKGIVSSMIKNASLEACRAQDTLNMRAKHKVRGEQEVSSHYRKGIVGDWHNHLSEAQAMLVENLVGDLEKRVFAKFKNLKGVS